MSRRSELQARVDELRAKFQAYEGMGSSPPAELLRELFAAERELLDATAECAYCGAQVDLEAPPPAGGLACDPCAQRLYRALGEELSRVRKLSGALDHETTAEAVQRALTDRDERIAVLLATMPQRLLN